MKILIVGAGLSGAVIAREAAELGHSVHVIDRRDHIAGNAADFVNEHGIRQHRYGPHLFHTNNKKVYDYLSKFTEWIPYKHRVRAQLDDGSTVVLPVNREGAERVGKDNIIDIFYRPYTRKMWAKDLEEIDPTVISRVKIRDDDNEYYFPDDEYQAMPKLGYVEMVRNMLDHPHITVSLHTNFHRSMEPSYDRIFNSMSRDEYYNGCFGQLQWRSIKFHTVHLPLTKVLDAPTLNFTHNGPYTRVTEWKQIPGHGHNSMYTTLTYEEPCDFKDNNDEKYYPVKDVDGRNREIYQKYCDLEHRKMVFIGRCGQYAYLDMHQAVSSALSLVQKHLCTTL